MRSDTQLGRGSNSLPAQITRPYADNDRVTTPTHRITCRVAASPVADAAWLEGNTIRG
ncbi:MAG: hypothetical protein HKN91_12725 [Acidimicrobiia bacterium]|nr:hypothetical protein [Acidimicrobiia bacterium]